MTAATFKDEDKNINRRIADRIYEQSNLFYRKIDRSQPPSVQSGFDALLPPSSATLGADFSLPTSTSLENDTLNVNISATGIAFTCAEQLNPGDYLLLRILLLSSMTVIMTSCRVVYCKPSNPYETDRYPYFIGAEFINMAPEDSELLRQHVSKKHKQRWVIKGSILAVLMVILLNPLEALHLAMELGHYLIEMLLHALHLTFEYLEMGLDHLVEHTFHTGLHETQIIVFYTLLSCGLTALYFIGRRIPVVVSNFTRSQLLYWQRKKASTLYFWGEQSTLDKVKIIGISAGAIFAYLFFGF